MARRAAAPARRTPARGQGLPAGQVSPVWLTWSGQDSNRGRLWRDIVQVNAVGRLAQALGGVPQPPRWPSDGAVSDADLGGQGGGGRFVSAWTATAWL
ncbi:hypothetical protein [Micromonospora sp. WMMD1274]|uniref:hypothetical protein n=1 Tax=Micromonospora sp. WMMD1274 TaxID=3404116 RepID=UPI003B9635AD